ncbi:M20/M25/M40 family metallo-hydrolase [Suicoccus acidiformans]|nr:M20/M25/M40 family metallo-hydrolase [Suicoccus acidiformans]
MSYFERNFAKMQDIAADLFAHPELGYKEFYTKSRVEDFIHDVTPETEIHYFSTTGMRVNLNTGQKMTLAFVAELDAVKVPGHFQADPETGAAHACGHFTQVTTALSLYGYLTEDKRYQYYDFNFAFIFVPAEEFIDLEYRQSLIDEGVITYMGGKPEAMKLGVFDDVDFAMCVHTIGGAEEKLVEINCDLAGFLYKHYRFEGKASHAGWDPFSGVNAYSMSTLFNTGLGLMRQQLREDVYVRINPVIDHGNFSTNVIPDEVQVGSDLRTVDVEYMKVVAERMDKVAKGAAYALEGKVQIQTQMGYLPFVQARYLSNFVREAFQAQDTIPHWLEDRGAVAAAGDIGDLSYMIPSIQISYGGFTGTIHGNDLRMVDEPFVLQEFPEFLVSVLDQMNGRIDPDQLYRRSYDDYATYIQSIVHEGETHEE